MYAGYTICTSREHIVYGAFCGSTMRIATCIVSICQKVRPRSSIPRYKNGYIKIVPNRLCTRYSRFGEAVLMSTHSLYSLVDIICIRDGKVSG